MLEGNTAGVSLWRQVSEALTADIESGRLTSGQRLPTSADLAARFTVNRHTALKAIAYLQSEGLIRIERGRGAYAIVNPVEFRLGPRQWFEHNLLKNNRIPSRTILSIEEIPAVAEVAQPLNLKAKSPVLFVTILGEADGLPVNYGYHYFPLKRLPGIAEAFRAVGKAPSKTFSFSTVLKSVGVSDWRRKSVRIRARPPSREEATRLQIAPSDAVMVTNVLSVDGAGVPVVYANTCYGSSRSELLIEL